MISNQDELALSVDEIEWSCLRAHLLRGGLILIEDSLNLVETAATMARNDTATIEKLITMGKICKPSENQIQTWDCDKLKKFNMLIVSPYVLIQERLLTDN